MNMLTVKADVGSLLTNITKFFAHENAYIQELLQNARRAEAGNVIVSLTEKYISVRDNGSGVEDPEKLVTIGGSKWRPDTAKEMPAGMGLFSGFKVAKVITIRSSNWRVVMDREVMNRTGQAKIEYMKESIQGTEIRLDLKDKIDGNNEYHEWLSTARYMPYKTTIHYTQTDDKGKKIQETDEVDAFNPNKVPGYEIGIKLSCGMLWITNNATAYQHGNGHFVTQGVALPMSEIGTGWLSGHSGFMQHRFLLCIDTGAIDLRLPDRGSAIKNKKMSKVKEEVEAAFKNYCVEQVTKGQEHERRTAYAKFISTQMYSLIPQLPKEYQFLPIEESDDYRDLLRRPEEIHDFSKEGTLVSHEVGGLKLLEDVLGVQSLYALRDGDSELPVLKAVLGEIPRRIMNAKILIKSHKTIYGGAYLWHVDKVNLTWSNGTKEERPPSKSVARIVDLDHLLDDGVVAFATSEDEEFWNEHANDMDYQSFVLVHTTPEGKEIQDINDDEWNNNEFGDGMDSDDAWEDANLRHAILSCSAGLFANGVPLADICSSIRTKFAVKKSPDDEFGICPDVSFEDVDMEVHFNHTTLKSGTLVMEYDVQGETLGHRRIVFRTDAKSVIQQVSDTGFIKAKS